MTHAPCWSRSRPDPLAGCSLHRIDAGLVAEKQKPRKIRFEGARALASHGNRSRTKVLGFRPVAANKPLQNDLRGVLCSGSLRSFIWLPTRRESLSDYRETMPSAQQDAYLTSREIPARPWLARTGADHARMVQGSSLCRGVRKTHWPIIRPDTQANALPGRGSNRCRAVATMLRVAGVLHRGAWASSSAWSRSLMQRGE